MSGLLSVYHKLPPFARSAVAGARGTYLNWWRYGGQTEKIVEETLARDYWSETEWADWRSEKLGFILERAATKVPFYKEYWSGLRKNGNTTSWSYLENWPVLEKSDLRKNALSFVADDCSIASMFHDHTSGTTGSSLDLWLKRETVKLWYAIFEARCRRWYGFSRHDRWAIVGGQLVVPAGQRKPPFWIWNFGLNQLYLSAYHLSPETIPVYLTAITKHRVRYLLGYPSAMFTIAKQALRLNQRTKLDLVITNAEPLLDYQREVIREAFSCEVRETYGMAETVAAGSECEHGKMHQWPDVGIVEVESDGGDTAGEFICTGLLNPDMPLIRYRVGDRGTVSNDSCDCGRKLPLFSSIDGRNDDVVLTPDGREVGRLDPVFKSGVSVVEAQIIQESLKLITVKVVPDEGFDMAAGNLLKSRIKERVGDIEVCIETVESIPRTANGKFRAVISKVIKDRKAII